MDMTLKDSTLTDQQDFAFRLKKKTTVMKTTRTLFKTLDEVVLKHETKCTELIRFERITAAERCSPLPWEYAWFPDFSSH